LLGFLFLFRCCTSWYWPDSFLFFCWYMSSSNLRSEISECCSNLVGNCFLSSGVLTGNFLCTYFFVSKFYSLWYSGFYLALHSDHDIRSPWSLWWWKSKMLGLRFLFSCFTWSDCLLFCHVFVLPVLFNEVSEMFCLMLWWGDGYWWDFFVPDEFLVCHVLLNSYWYHSYSIVLRHLRFFIRCNF